MRNYAVYSVTPSRSAYLIYARSQSGRAKYSGGEGEHCLHLAAAGTTNLHICILPKPRGLPKERHFRQEALSKDRVLSGQLLIDYLISENETW
jgi:hypothetical protein